MRGTVPVALDGERVDRAVALLTGLTRAEVAQAVADGRVRVGGHPVTRRSSRVRAGDEIEAEVLPAAAEEVVADPSVDVLVVHEDAHLLVVDKPPGLVVHPGAGQAQGTLVHGLLARYPELASVGEPSRPGIVHRLDRGTSGLLVVARTAAAYHGLVAALGGRQVERRYAALAWGRFDAAEGLVDAPVGRATRHPTRMAVSARGREARTRYRVRRTYDRPASVSLLACQLETGRTHQIRVHLSAIGHPVVGDARYGGAREPLTLERPFLHAEALAFTHPVSGERISLSSPLPPDLTAVLVRLS